MSETIGIELKKLRDEIKRLFFIENISEIGKALFDCVRKGDEDKYENFCRLVGDLSIDWLQMIFQYYQADRKDKKQDYTPKTLADFIGRLAGNDEKIIDMCAGSGSLTIQKWNRNRDLNFELYEFDEKVIPFLLFNMAVRNISCVVFHYDVLQQELFHTYQIKKGENFGIFKEVENGKYSYF